MFEFQTSPEFSYKNPSSLSLFCFSFRDNIHARITASFQWLCRLGGRNRLKCLDGGSLDLGFAGFCLFGLFCFSFKNLTSIDLPENPGRFLLLDILKIKNYGVFVSFLRYFYM